MPLSIQSFPESENDEPVTARLRPSINWHQQTPLLSGISNTPGNNLKTPGNEEGPMGLQFKLDGKMILVKPPSATAISLGRAGITAVGT
ncbi:hypothetical protein [Nitrospirillum sp. BR 11163]|uniref:hypothetical protein n=1 Tax=Nitrospirillum sp. BR 11163 TaxID=3104323 RepID=UPI002AFE5F90|nr:hypothetical protein [Nitrospirillum sp. BR 11163]MEA1674543.1 hypothetical protein [Nitrospirillum sp. BR 11163]